MSTFIHVDRHALQRTREDGQQRPTVVVGDEQDPHRDTHYAVELPERSIVKTLSTPLSCGATIVVETMGDVKSVSRMVKENFFDFDDRHVHEFVPYTGTEDCFRCGAPKSTWCAYFFYGPHYDERGFELCDDCYKAKSVLNFFVEKPVLLLGRVVEPEGKTICR